MLASIMETLNSINWQEYLSHVSNDKIIEFFTSIYGLIALGVLLIASILCKWRLLTAAILGGVGIAVLANLTLSDSTSGPDRTLLFFAAGGVAVGAFLIYFLFIQDE